MNLKLRHSDGFWPYSLALAYVASAYFGGFALLIAGPLYLWLPAVLLVGHGMVIAAYLIHDCAHNALFAESTSNARLGELLSWISGACYGSYQNMRLKHVRHHVDRADVVSFDYRTFLKAHPLLLKLARMLEWGYIPAVDLLMHGFVIAAPFTHETYRQNRRRVITSLLIRGTLLLALALFAPAALVGYIAAYILFVSVMRLMDMHQHTFDVFVSPEADARPPERPDAAYEQRNTFSNVLGRGVLANLLVLNFGYHNAHHIKPNAAFYQLPRLHRELFGDETIEQELPAKNLFRSYHRHRVTRVLSAETGDAPIGTGEHKGLQYVGVYGVSFLTAL